MISSSQDLRKSIWSTSRTLSYKENLALIYWLQKFDHPIRMLKNECSIILRMTVY